MGVWIETCVFLRIKHGVVSHTLRGCVDWNIIEARAWAIEASHTLRGCVDWNRIKKYLCFLSRSHTLRGCVDWNFRNFTYAKTRLVTPCVGVWIETYLAAHPVTAFLSHPAWVCGLKRKTSRSPILLYGSHPAWVCGLKLKTYCTIFYYLSHTLRGCVDWNSYEKEIR